MALWYKALNGMRHESAILRTMIPNLSLARTVQGIAVAIGCFAALGTVAVLWENPLFVRMTPAGDLEIAVLAVLSVLLGAYVAIRRPFCSAKTAGAGGVLGFIGIACPVCNKILLLIFGGELLVTYFEPVRIYVAAVGVLAVAAATAREWVLAKRQSAAPAAGLPRDEAPDPKFEGAR